MTWGTELELLSPGEADARPRLWWIKGDGTFLMSNGITAAPNTRAADGSWHHIVYADGWGPATDPSTVLGQRRPPVGRRLPPGTVRETCDGDPGDCPASGRTWSSWSCPMRRPGGPNC
ncbi:DUF3085 domain-containing protein [Streptomyces sp. RK62]|uniref:DUF3085 domain-containing protein n=1 Tax=Streptomyces sp. RK62 TaxID=2824893 RepID=UPI001FFDE7BA|nr:DUF3085 domain-containing protein [Streptomyces sp. RK62]